MKIILSEKELIRELHKSYTGDCIIRHATDNKYSIKKIRVNNRANGERVFIFYCEHIYESLDKDAGGKNAC